MAWLQVRLTTAITPWIIVFTANFAVSKILVMALFLVAACKVSKRACVGAAHLLWPQSASSKFVRSLHTTGQKQHSSDSRAPSGPIGVEPVRGLRKPAKPTVDDKCGDPIADDDEDEDMVKMIDANTGEWGGPTRGGTAPEPTRFGDWERKGRCTDF